MEKYEKKLRDLLAELEAEVNTSSAECAPVQVDGSMGRVSRGDAIQVQQLALEINRRREERILRVQSALMRIQQGTYGLCVRCQCPIDQNRLDLLPEVVLCVNCASSPKR